MRGSSARSRVLVALWAVCACDEVGGEAEVVVAVATPAIEGVVPALATAPPPPTQGGLNATLLDALGRHDLVYLAGQAKSHCVLESLRSMVSYFEHEPAVLGKLRLLGDCTSSVAHPDIDFDQIAEAEIAKFVARGVKVVRSTDALG